MIHWFEFGGNASEIVVLSDMIGLIVVDASEIVVFSVSIDLTGEMLQRLWYWVILWIVMGKQGGNASKIVVPSDIMDLNEDTYAE